MKYTLVVERNEDGKLSMRSTNDGFSVFELIGIHAFKMDDIRRQGLGEIKPDIISRTAIEDK
jgi:hypothetical protein